MTAGQIAGELTLAAEESLLAEDEITIPSAGALEYLGADDPASKEPGLPLYWRDPDGQVWAVTVAVTVRPADPARLPAAVRQQITR